MERDGGEEAQVQDELYPTARAADVSPLAEQTSPQIVTSPAVNSSIESIMPQDLSALQSSSGLHSQEFEARSFSGLKPHFARAEKDASDPTESFYRRNSIDRSVSSTRTAINTLFKASTPHSLPSSRQTSYLRSISPNPSMPSLVSQGLALGTHIYNNGLLEGRHSDICVNAFGSKYRLHRLILEQSPYFASTFSGRWLEASSKEIDLHPEHTDVNITKEAFELALKRIYGCSDPREETFHCLGLLPTACWLEMPQLVDDSVEIIIRTLEAPEISPVINLVTSNYYGKAGERILQAANILLRREGAAVPIRSWDHIPGQIVKEIVGADDFFVKTEWDRWLLAKKLLNRRLKLIASLSGLEQDSAASQSALQALRRAGRPHLHRLNTKSKERGSFDCDALRDWRELYNHPEITALYALLDEKINYVHMDFETLQHIKSARDAFGIPFVSQLLIADALWASVELRQKVLSANSYDPQLGLAKLCDDPNDNASIAEFASDSGPLHQTIVQDYGEAKAEDSVSGRDAPRYLIPRIDCNISIGADAAPLKASEERKRARNTSTRFHFSEPANSPSLADSNKTPDPTDNEAEQQRYSLVPPFRFSVEFPSPLLLDDRKPIYSQTVFYAGSFWNVYIQKLRKESKESKAAQLGIYLRRTEDHGYVESGVRQGEGKQVRRSVDHRIGELEQDMLQATSRQSGNISMAMGSPDELSHAENYPSFTLVSNDGLNVFGTIDSTDGEDETLNGPAQPPVIPPYIDGRQFVKAYFKIFCPGAGGRSLSIWESVPDNFSLRQSWGWRSYSLIADATPSRGKQAVAGSEQTTLGLSEDSSMPWTTDDIEPLGEQSDSSSLGSDSLLRFSVVIGVV